MADKKLFTPLSGTQRIFEAVLIAITLMAAYLLLALLTYHPADPGWSQTSWQGEVKNLAGSAGAWLADITMFTFGAFSYLVPPLVVLLGWSLFWRPSRLLEVDYLTLSVRIIGFVLTVLGMSAIASMNFNDLQNFSAGGLVGDVIASAVVPLFGGVGANLMLLCFVATGITLFTGWSWLTIVERIGATCTGSVSAIYHFPTTLGRWLTGGWRQPRFEGPDPLLEGGVGALDLDDEEDEPHSSWTRNPKAKGARSQNLTNGCRSSMTTPSSSIRNSMMKRTSRRPWPDPSASPLPMPAVSRPWPMTGMTSSICPGRKGRRQPPPLRSPHRSSPSVAPSPPWRRCRA